MIPATIEKAENGYIVRHHEVLVFGDLSDVFDEIKRYFTTDSADLPPWNYNLLPLKPKVDDGKKD